MDWQYQSNKCDGKKSVLNFSNIVVFVALSIIFPYLMIAFPLSFVIQMRFSKIFQKNAYWECRLIFLFTALILALIILTLDALVFNKVIYETLSILNYINK